LKPLNLTGLCFWQLVYEINHSRVFIRSGIFFKPTLNGFSQLVASIIFVFQHNVSANYHSPFFIRKANHGTFKHFFVSQKHTFYFDSGNIVARGNNHIVSTSYKPVITVFVFSEDVSRKVPTVLNVFLLFVRAVEVLTARNSTNGKSSLLVGREFITLVVNDFGFVSCNWHSGCARTHIFFIRRNKNM